MRPTAKLTKKTAKRTPRPLKAAKNLNFGTLAKTVSGMVRSGKGDLSSREGFSL
jgi:hypothetical protein